MTPLADIHTLGHKSKSVGIDQLLIAGAHLPAIINQRGESELGHHWLPIGHDLLISTRALNLIEVGKTGCESQRR